MRNIVRKGIEAIKQGDRARARRLLIQALNEDPYDADAWCILANLVAEKSKKIVFLKKALQLQPGHVFAERLLHKLERKSTTNAGGQPDRTPEQIERNAGVTILVDNLIDGWLRRLSESERDTLKRTYRLEVDESNMDSGIMASVDERDDALRLQALEKLREPESKARMWAFTSVLLQSISERGGKITESEMLTELSNGVGFGRYRRLGAARLILDVEESVEWHPIEHVWVMVRRHGETQPAQSSRKPTTAKIEVLGLSARAFNSLRRAGIDFVDQLSTIDPENLQQIRNIGPNTASEIQERLKHYLEDGTERQLQISSEKSVQVPRVKEVRLGEIRKPIALLGFSTRTQNALIRGEVHTVGKLASLSEDELLEISNIGPTALAEIDDRLSDYLASNPHIIDVDRPDDDPGSSVQLSDQQLAWFLEAPLEDLPLSRLGISLQDEVGLANREITTVKQLIEQRDNLVHFPEVRTSLKQYLNWLRDQDRHVWNVEARTEGISEFFWGPIIGVDLEVILSDWLEVLTEREQGIIRWRFGLQGETLTLAEIGKRFDVSRERIRQLQSTALAKLQQEAYLIKAFILFVVDALIRHGGLLDETDLVDWLGRAERQVFLGNARVQGLLELLAEVTDEFRYDSKGFAVLTRHTSELVKMVQSNIREILDRKLRPLSAEVLIRELDKIDGHEQPYSEVDRSFLLACIRVHPDLEERRDATYGLKQWQNRIIDEIIMALRDIGEPSHYSDIAEKTNSLLPADDQTAARNVHSHLGRYEDIFVRVGHGIFGLAEWGLHDDGNLANAAYRVISEAGKPIHIDLITKRVLQTWHVQPNSVYMAIQNDDRFTRVGSGVYFLRGHTAKMSQTGGAEFADLFGEQLSKWEDEFGRDEDGQEDEAFAEVQKLHEIGLDFFDD